MLSSVLEQDLEYTYSRFSDDELKKFEDATILITGCGGFLGQYHLAFFDKFFQRLKLKKVVGIDRYLLGKSPYIKELETKTEMFDLRCMDICSDEVRHITDTYEIDYIIHMASVASPIFYRKHPLETLDSNVWGLRNLLELFREKALRGFLFYSSSEIYGNPVGVNVIPTPESYWGNVSPAGPRACYDEAKRFGETLCYYYEKLYAMPISIVRLFNIYGPGMNINDRRVPADFVKSIVNNVDIEIYSDGHATRSFCYAADSVAGELKAMLHPGHGAFNIGIDERETSIAELAEVYKACGRKVCGYSGAITYRISEDKDYLTHNPLRRRPDLKKATTILDYKPSIPLNDGVERYIKYVLEIGDYAAW